MSIYIILQDQHAWDPWTIDIVVASFLAIFLFKKTQDLIITTIC